MTYDGGHGVPCVQSDRFGPTRAHRVNSCYAPILRTEHVLSGVPLWATRRERWRRPFRESLDKTAMTLP